MITIAKGTNWLFVGTVVGSLLFILAISGGLNLDQSYHTKRVADRLRADHLELLQTLLDGYFAEENSFPTSLAMSGKDIPKDPRTNKDYFYAFYPSENPTAYHLGALLESRNAIILETDSDFSSKAAGYVNGFDGEDPVYDLHVSK